MLDLNVPQPAPTSGEGPSVWPLVYDAPGLVLPAWLLSDMRARDLAGAAKYGTPLRVWNGRDAVVDAYQEALDLVVYTQQARSRLPALTLGKADTLLNLRLTLDIAFHHALQIACRLGELAQRQQVPTTPPKEGRR